MNRKLAFLDLEQTVIDSWESGLFLPGQCAHIKSRLDTIRPDAVGLFSFAVWNQKDLDQFNNTLLRPLETVLERRLDPDLCLHLGSLAETLRSRLSWQTLELTELFDIFRKDTAFVEYSCTYKDTTLWLFDDAVSNQVHCFPDQNVQVFIERVDPVLEDEWVQRA